MAAVNTVSVHACRHHGLCSWRRRLADYVNCGYLAPLCVDRVLLAIHILECAWPCAHARRRKYLARIVIAEDSVSTEHIGVDVKARRVPPGPYARGVPCGTEDDEVPHRTYNMLADRAAFNFAHVDPFAVAAPTTLHQLATHDAATVAREFLQVSICEGSQHALPAPSHGRAAVFKGPRHRRFELIFAVNDLRQRDVTNVELRKRQVEPKRGKAVGAIRNASGSLQLVTEEFHGVVVEVFLLPRVVSKRMPIADEKLDRPHFYVALHVRHYL